MRRSLVTLQLFDVARSVTHCPFLGKIEAMTTTEVHVYVHVDGGVPENLSVQVYLPPDTDTTELEGLLMATKEEVLASIADVKTALVELQSDVQRIITDLETAIANNDLTAVAAAVEDLKATVTTIDEAVETASPEPTEPPVEPTP